jgi:hypothetical protein
MSCSILRRRFLQAIAVGGLSTSFRRVQANESEAAPIRFGGDLEPIVRLIEETPREKCVPVLVEQLRTGLPQRRFLAAIFLAALRKQNSHHSVYLVHSAHQVSLDVAPPDRLLPLFWAVDHFKWHQEKFPTPALLTLAGPLPRAEQAEAEFHEAMKQSDLERAERATTALAHSTGARQAFDLLWRYACRDVSLIGHRAIAVANCWRTLETVGWQHAEPVLRFVVQNLLTTNGKPDQYYEPNHARVAQAFDRLSPSWPGGLADPKATLELFGVLIQGNSERACELAMEQLESGTGAQPLWDAVHIAAAELLILHKSETGMAARPLHANTATNALRCAFQVSSNSRIRLLILLQAIAWIGDFVHAHRNELNLVGSSPADLGGAARHWSAASAVQEIFEELPPRTYDLTGKTRGGYAVLDREARTSLGRKVFGLVDREPGAAGPYTQAARQMLCTKAAVEAHEFKLPPALFEDCEFVSPEWRPRLLAASAHWLHGKRSPDSEILQQVRREIRKL